MLLEVGPGQTLRQLALRHPRAAEGSVAMASLTGGATSEQHSFLRTLGRLWETGMAVDWAGFQAGEIRRRVPLPTYPFQRQRFWIDPAPRSSALPALHQNPAAKIPKLSNVSQWFWAPSWKLSPVAQTESDATPASCWIVFLDELGLAAALVELLEGQGKRVIQVRSGNCFEQLQPTLYSIDPADSTAYSKLFRSIRAAGLEVHRMLHAFSFGFMSSLTAAEARFHEYQQRGLYSLLHLLQAIAAEPTGQGRRLYVLSSNSMDVESPDRLVPEKAGLAAFCKVAGQEAGGLACCAIDVPASADFRRTAEHLLPELDRIDIDAVVAYRGRNRWVQHYEPLSLNRPNFRHRTLRPGGVYLITGGLGAVGTIIAEYLSSTLGAKLVLTTTPRFLPARDGPKYSMEQTDNPRSGGCGRRCR